MVRRLQLTVTMNLGVSNFQRAISIVIPRSRSAFSLSRTQAERKFFNRHKKFNHAFFSLTILEGALSELSSLLLELLDGTLIDTTALVDQVAGSGGLSGVDVTDDWKQGSGKTSAGR